MADAELPKDAAGARNPFEEGFEPADARPASTILLLRRGGKHADRRLEVLLVKRNEGARFMPGVWVFPGGRVEADELITGVSGAEWAPETPVISSSASTRPPGKTHTPGMNRALPLRLTKSTSRRRWASLPPLLRSRIVEAGRAAAGSKPSWKGLRAPAASFGSSASAAELHLFASRGDARLPPRWARLKPSSSGSALRAGSSIPRRRDPDGGIPPGTDFAEIPETAPVCGARKADFEPYEE